MENMQQVYEQNLGSMEFFYYLVFLLNQASNDGIFLRFCVSSLKIGEVNNYKHNLQWLLYK